jgi:hypothetical protein
MKRQGLERLEWENDYRLSCWLRLGFIE